MGHVRKARLIRRILTVRQCGKTKKKSIKCKPRRRASEPRSGVARCSGPCAQGSLNSPTSYRRYVCSQCVSENLAWQWNGKRVNTYMRLHFMDFFFVFPHWRTVNMEPRWHEQLKKKPWGAPWGVYGESRGVWWRFGWGLGLGVLGAPKFSGDVGAISKSRSCSEGLPRVPKKFPRCALTPSRERAAQRRSSLSV